MPGWNYRLVICALSAVAVGLSANAQSPSSTPPSTPPPSAAPAAADKPADPPAPSPETLKRAKAVGLHAENRKGGTVYCWEDATLGTRFTTKKCVDDNALESMIEQREAQKDRMRSSVGAQ